MRATHCLAAALGAATALGCAAQRPPVAAPGHRIAAVRSPADSIGARVELFAPTPQAVRYRIDEPAYVTVFGVDRGRRGVRLLYPTAPAEQRTEPPGYHVRSLPRSGLRPGLAASFHDVENHIDPEVAPNTAPPEFLYIVASPEPLPLASFFDAPFMFRRTLGGTDFARTRPTFDEAVALIHRAVIPTALAGRVATGEFRVTPGYQRF